ncbi:MAG: hypothetical protein IJU56_06975 [Clostridia bacterium]|nr:hypothetical protein [Clostridia bacterium]
MRKAKQILSILLAVLMIALSVPVAVAEGEPCSHDNMMHYSAGTKGHDGYVNVEYWYCYDCDSYYLDELGTREVDEDDIFTIPCPHENMEHYLEGQTSNYEYHGYLNIEFWHCYRCGYYFADQNGNQKLTENEIFILPCLHKNCMHYPEGSVSREGYLNIEVWVCQECGLLFSDEAKTHEITSTEEIFLIPCSHSRLEHHAQGSDYRYDKLNIEYWSCGQCHQYFSDAAATQTIDSSNIYVLTCTHTNMIYHEEGTECRNGNFNTAYWSCENCHKDFAVQNVTDSTTVLSSNDIFTIPCTHKNVRYSEGEKPSCGKNGSIAHWHCSDCYKNFSDQKGENELTYDELYSVVPDYAEHDFLYDLSFEEKDDQYWLSLGFAKLSLDFGPYYMQEQLYDLDSMLFDAQHGKITQTYTYSYYTLTYTWQFKYCAHCGAVCEEHATVRDSSGIIIKEGETSNSIYLSEEAYLHQPGPVDNDLEGLTEIPTSAEGLAYGEEYFDRAAFAQYFVSMLEGSMTEESSMAEFYANWYRDYISAARFFFNDDRSRFIILFDDLYIVDSDTFEGSEGEDIVDDPVAIVSSYIKVNTNTDICTHVWNDGVVTTPASCAEPGVKTFTCTKCGNTKTETIPATGVHAWDDGVVTQAPNCGRAGVKTFTCTVCGKTRTESIPTVGQHIWDDGRVTKLATFTETGICTYTCTVCKYRRTETIPKLVPQTVLEDLNQKQSLDDTADNGAVYFDQSANLPADTVFDFNVLEKTDWYETIELKLTSGGEEVEPETPVWVKIPVPAGWSPIGITVWHGWEQLPSFVENGYIYFYTSHFSEFQFKYQEQNNDDNPTAPTVPDTDADLCKWCGKVHEGFFQKIIAFFHNILAMILGARY